MLRWRREALCALVLAAAASSVARAQPAASPPDDSDAPSLSAGCAGERYLVLQASAPLEEKLIAEVRTDLATDLEKRGLSVAEAAPSGCEPAVNVKLRALEDGIAIEVDDRVTHKRVARDLSLTKIPANGRALAIAIAIDELIRASWAELSLRPLGTPAEPAPRADEPTVEGEIETRTVNARGSVVSPSERRRAFTLRAAAAYAHTKHSYDALGGALGAALHPFRRGWLELRAEVLASLATDTPRGDVLSRSAGASLTFGGCLPPAGRAVYGCLGARAGGDWVMLRGEGAVEARALRRHAGIARAGGAALFAVGLGERAHWFADVSLAAVLRGARATDGARTLLGVAGALLVLQTGIGVEL